MADPRTYSGVPNGAFTPGQPVTTGLAGPSNSSDYTSSIYARVGNTWQLVPPGTTIPAGASISIGQPPVAGSSSGGTGAGDTVTGYGIVDQAETQRHNIATETNASAQTANQAAQIAAQRDAAAQAHADTMAQLQQSMQQAANQFALDSARFGLDTAKFNYEQNVANSTAKYQQATLALQNCQYKLSSAQFNASQIQAREAMRLEITKTLADASGPGDWVKYNRLLNGLAAPTPTSTTVSDPYAGLKDMYQPYTEPPPAVPDLSIPNTQFTGTVPTAPTVPNLLGTTAASSGTSTGATGGGLGGGVGVAPVPAGASGGINKFQPAPGTAQPGGATQGYGAGAPGSGFGVTPQPGYTLTPSGTVAKGTTGANGQRLPVTIDPNVPADASGYRWDSANSQWVDPNHGNQAYTPMASGGMTQGAAVVGDSKSGKPTGHEEIAYAATNPQTGAAELHVVPHEHVARLLDQALGRNGGTVLGGHKMPPNMLEAARASGMPRAAAGGVYPTADPRAQGTAAWGGAAQPFYTGLDTEAGQLPGGGYGASAQLSPTPYPVGGDRPMSGGGVSTTPSQPLTAPSSAPQGGGQTAPGISANGGTTGLGGGITSGGTTNAATAPSTPNLLGGGATPASSGVGGNNQPAFVPDAPGTYGGERSQDWTVTNTYSPQQLGSQPFIQKIQGLMGDRPYGGFGATINNAKLGIQDFNPLISLQRYNMLQPSEQEQLKSLINQGLGLSFDDILAGAQRSAPLPQNRGLGRAIQPSTYGR